MVRTVHLSAVSHSNRWLWLLCSPHYWPAHGFPPSCFVLLHAVSHNDIKAQCLVSFFILIAFIGLWQGCLNVVVVRSNPLKLRACCFNPLMPNVNYIGRTAPLTSKVAFYIFIQQM